MEKEPIARSHVSDVGFNHLWGTETHPTIRGGRKPEPISGNATGPLEVFGPDRVHLTVRRNRDVDALKVCGGVTRGLGATQCDGGPGCSAVRGHRHRDVEMA